MPKYHSLSHAVSTNEQCLCKVEACSRLRIGLSPYCLPHRRAYTANGHPLQRKVRASRYEVERLEMARLFESNRDHPGIKSAVRAVQQWMDSAVVGTGAHVFADDLRRLSDFGVSALDVVTEVAALYLFQEWNRHLYASEDAENVALSLAVLRLAPLAKRTRVSADGTERQVQVQTKAAPRKRLGKWLKAQLLPLLMNLKGTVEKNRNALLTSREAMLSPLIYPEPTITTIKQKEPK